MSQQPLSERDRALVGPRLLKPRGSPEWCWQTADLLKNYYANMAQHWREVEAIRAELAEVRAWEVIPPGAPYGSEDALLRGELGVPKRALDQRIVNYRQAAEEERLQAEAQPQGGDRRSVEFKDNNVVLETKPQGNQAKQALRRLRVSGESNLFHAELYRRVLAGDLSPHAAAIEAGFRVRTLTVPVDPERAARILRKHFVGEALAQLVAALRTTECSA